MKLLTYSHGADPDVCDKVSKVTVAGVSLYANICIFTYVSLYHLV